MTAVVNKKDVEAGMSAAIFILAVACLVILYYYSQKNKDLKIANINITDLESKKMAIASQLESQTTKLAAKTRELELITAEMKSLNQQLSAAVAARDQALSKASIDVQTLKQVHQAEIDQLNARIKEILKVSSQISSVDSRAAAVQPAVVAAAAETRKTLDSLVSIAQTQIVIDATYSAIADQMQIANTISADAGGKQFHNALYQFLKDMTFLRYSYSILTLGVIIATVKYTYLKNPIGILLASFESLCISDYSVAFFRDVLVSCSFANHEKNNNNFMFVILNDAKQQIDSLCNYLLNNKDIAGKLEWYDGVAKYFDTLRSIAAGKNTEFTQIANLGVAGNGQYTFPGGFPLDSNISAFLTNIQQGTQYLSACDNYDSLFGWARMSFVTPTDAKVKDFSRYETFRNFDESVILIYPKISIGYAFTEKVFGISENFAQRNTTDFNVYMNNVLNIAINNNDPTAVPQTAPATAVIAAANTAVVANADAALELRAQITSMIASIDTIAANMGGLQSINSTDHASIKKLKEEINKMIIANKQVDGYRKLLDAIAREVTYVTGASYENNDAGAVSALRDLLQRYDRMRMNIISVNKMGVFDANSGLFTAYDGMVPSFKTKGLLALGVDISGNDRWTTGESGVQIGTCKNSPGDCYAYTFPKSDWNRVGQNLKRGPVDANYVDTPMQAARSADWNTYVNNTQNVILPANQYIRINNNPLAYSLDVLQNNILTEASVENVEFIGNGAYPACLNIDKNMDGALIGMYNNNPWCKPFRSRARDAAGNVIDGQTSYVVPNSSSMVYLNNPSTLNYERW